MSIEELEAAVLQLPADELKSFAEWFEEYLADQWDRQIEADIAAGRLDSLGEQTQTAFDTGKCTPL